MDTRACCCSRPRASAPIAGCRADADGARVPSVHMQTTKFCDSLAGAAEARRVAYRWSGAHVGFWSRWRAAVTSRVPLRRRCRSAGSRRRCRRRRGQCVGKSCPLAWRPGAVACRPHQPRMVAAVPSLRGSWQGGSQRSGRGDHPGGCVIGTTGVGRRSRHRRGWSRGRESLLASVSWRVSTTAVVPRIRGKGWRLGYRGRFG